MRKTRRLAVTAAAVLLLGGIGAQGAVWTWTNGSGDNVFTNTANWSPAEFPALETMVVSLSGVNRAIHAGGETPNMDGMRVSYVSGDVGEFVQTGGVLNMTGLATRETVVGHVGTGIWTMSGGVAYMNNMAIGAGGGNGTVTLSNGVMEFAHTYNGNSIIIGTENPASVGTFDLVGGVLKTAYGINLGKDNGGSSTFHLNGGGGIVSNGVLNNLTSGNWYQDATSTLKATIDSDDGFSLGQIIISDGSNDNPSVTFQYGALLDVGFSGADMGDVTNSWDLITWPTNTVVTDGGLNFNTNTVDLADWSFAITNNALRLTYGIGSNPVIVTNPPPSGPRTLYWTGYGGTNDSQTATNWVTTASAAGTPATWGIYKEDNIYIGHDSVNAVDYVSEVDFSGADFDDQNRLYIGRGRKGILNFNSGTMILPKPTGTAVSSYIGWNSAGGDGVVNLNGGTLSLYSTHLGQTGGAQGTVNVNGGNLLLPGRIARAVGIPDRASIWVGYGGGTGTVNIVSGRFETLIGVALGDSGGKGTFCVEGTGATEVDIGGTRSDFDGFWTQNSGSTLKVVIDGTPTGVTPINIREDGNDNGGERAGLADVIFAVGSYLDVSWAAGVTNYGVFDIMTFGGSVSNDGLAFASSVDTNVWDFAFVDADNDSTNDTLRVMVPKGTTAQGTPLWWLYIHDLTEADDVLDSDNDGMLTWKEYVAETDPTNTASVLTITSAELDDSGYIVNWQSVEGKTYSVRTNHTLSGGSWGDAASGIIGLPGETSHTGTLSGASAQFLNIGVQ